MSFPSIPLHRKQVCCLLEGAVDVGFLTQPNALHVAQRTLLLKATFTEGPRALDHWNEWRQHGDLDVLDAGSYPALPQLFRNLERHAPSAPDLNRLRGVYRFHWSQNQLVLAALLQLVRVLRDADVDALLLKGSALLFSGDITDAPRPVSELDVMVPRERLNQALVALEHIGWTAKPATVRIDPSFTLASHCIALEHERIESRCNLYWAPFRGATWEGAEAPFWRCASAVATQDVSAHVLAPTEQLLHVCLHGRFSGASPPVECLADALYLLRAKSAALDWDRLQSLACEYHGVAELRASLRYLREELSALVPPRVIGALSNCPVSRLERLQGRLAARRQTRPSIRDVLLLHWLLHCRSLPGMSGVSRAARFPRYLRHTWRLSWREMPVHVGKSVVKRLRRTAARDALPS